MTHACIISLLKEHMFHRKLHAGIMARVQIRGSPFIVYNQTA